MITCDWCKRPLDSRWAYTMLFPAFAPNAPWREWSGRPTDVATRIHVHTEPCRAALMRAVSEVIEDHDPDDVTYVPDDENEVDGGEQTPAEKLNAKHEGWKQVPMVERERLVLEALGDDSLTISDLYDRMIASPPPGCIFYRSNAAQLVAALFKRRDLDREGESRGARGYSYFRRRTLEGPIADLERQFHDSEGRGA